VARWADSGGGLGDSYDYFRVGGGGLGFRACGGKSPALEWFLVMSQLKWPVFLGNLSRNGRYSFLAFVEDIDGVLKMLPLQAMGMG
jgi:hypothetical protein